MDTFCSGQRQPAIAQALAVELQRALQKAEAIRCLPAANRRAPRDSRRICARFDHAVRALPESSQALRRWPSGNGCPPYGRAPPVPPDVGRIALVQQQVPAVPGVVVEARHQMPGLEARRFNGGLRVMWNSTTLNNSWIRLAPGCRRRASTARAMACRASVISVGLSVTRGRLPPASSLGIREPA